MKKLSTLVLLVFATLTTTFSQRVAIVDVNDILTNMSQYSNAQKEIDKVAAEWQQEVAQEYDKIKSMYNKYQAEQVLLSDEARRQKEDEIVEKEKAVRELQKRRFGPEGDLFRKRQELVSPVQDMVFAAIEEYAAEKGLDLILDKSSSAGILYTSGEYNKTEEIKRRLDIK